MSNVFGFSDIMVACSNCASAALGNGKPLHLLIPTVQLLEKLTAMVVKKKNQ